MIKIDSNNIRRKKIGSGGISDRTLNKLCEKYQPYVKDVFKNKRKAGYDFLNLPDDSTLLRKIKRFAEDQKKNKWENIAVLGIGGSALGLIALKEALLGSFYNLKKKPRLFVLDNIDPDYINGFLSSVNISKTLFIVISKSGTTVEPMVLYGLIKKKLVNKHPKNYQKHLVFITDPKKGLLRKIAKNEKITVFDIPPKVGGRFSVLSSVGLVPAVLAGIDVKGLLKGARDMREIIKKNIDTDNPALLLAVLQYYMDRKKNKNITVLMPYSNLLFRMGDWYRQLLAESIGKNKKTGPTPINALGTTDQHSQLQLYAEGPSDKLIIFLKTLTCNDDLKSGNELPKELNFLNNKNLSDILNASYTGTSESLAMKKRPNITLEVSKIDAIHVGMLFMLFEFQTALLGFIYKVDAFNQPGVEHSKIITKQLLS